MSERVDALLQASGLSEPLIGSLERSDVLFVLTGGTLLYQDASGTRRVTLRDLTRIHSDQDGLLRVETPAGTALTASLLGFDPVDVQTFFGQVRDTTARVKQAALAAPLTPLQAAPIPKPHVPAQPVVAQPAPVQPVFAQPAPTPAPAVPARPPVVAVPTRAPDPAQGIEESVTVIRPAASAAAGAPTPAPTANPGYGVPRAAPVAAPAPMPARPVQVPPVQVAPPEAAVSQPAASQPAAPAKVAPPKGQPKAPEKAAQAAPVPVAPAGEQPSLVTPVEIPSAPALADSALAGSLGTLANAARSAGAWAGRLRFLSILLFLAALGLAFVQFSADQKLQALWVLIAGGIGAVALLALADLIRLVTSLASAYTARSGGLDAE